MTTTKLSNDYFENYYFYYNQIWYKLKFEEINCALNEKSLSEIRLGAKRPRAEFS